MKWTDEQFDRIARYLDGEAVDLSDAERAEAEAFGRELADLSAGLDVDIPRGTLDRARNKMFAELARPPHRANWSRYWAAGAVAGAVLLAVSMLFNPFKTVRGPISFLPVPTARVKVHVPIEVVVAEMNADGQNNVDLDLLAREVDDLAADIAVLKRPNANLDLQTMQTDALEQEINDFWLDDPYAIPLGG